MIVIPAIDLHEGRVVRLTKGDFRKVTVYSQDPASVAKSFEDAGAERIHVVDLDASVAGRGVNLDAIEAICSAVNAEVQLGGGIRTMEGARRAFELGVDYVILGTVTAKDPRKAVEIIEAFPGRVGIGLDALEGRLAVAGWKEMTEATSVDIARFYEKVGPAFIVYTDISRDGMLAGPNIEETCKLARSVAIPVIASGGISTMDDIRALAETGMIHGAITGKAVYEGRIDITKALELVRSLENGKQA